MQSKVIVAGSGIGFCVKVTVNGPTEETKVLKLSITSSPGLTMPFGNVIFKPPLLITAELNKSIDARVKTGPVADSVNSYDVQATVL